MSKVLLVVYYSVYVIADCLAVLACMPRNATSCAVHYYSMQCVIVKCNVILSFILYDSSV